MTMYLPNRDVLPTGYEAAEFIDTPIVGPAAEPAIEEHSELGDEDEPGA